MKTYLDCIPCFVRQAVDAGRHARLEEIQQEHLVRRVLQEISVMRFTDSPPVIGAKIHAFIREISDKGDPYTHVKDRSNTYAITLLPALKEEVQSSSDPFTTALRFALAGNVIDFGAASTVEDDTIHKTLQNAREAVLPEDEVKCLKRAVQEANSILYIGDNAGEIVFDRLFIEQLPAERVTFAVRGNPVINDVTMADAHRTGIVSIVKVIESGSATPGILLNECSITFQRIFEEADLIIAKGQGNYESLSDTDARIAFLLMAKCPVIARDIGCEVGSFVIKNGFGRNAYTKAEELHRETEGMNDKTSS